MDTGLKLMAETASDMQIVSAVLQDAIIRVGDIRLNLNAQTLTLVVSRFMHESDKSKRVKSGLRFHNILSMKAKGIDRTDPNAFLVMLSVEFVSDKKKPGGEVVLVFAGGGELRARAEYLETILIDYSNARETKSQPLHPLEA
jgi:hypothetical protein